MTQKTTFGIVPKVVFLCLHERPGKGAGAVFLFRVHERVIVAQVALGQCVYIAHIGVPAPAAHPLDEQVCALLRPIAAGGQDGQRLAGEQRRTAAGGDRSTYSAHRRSGPARPSWAQGRTRSGWARPAAGYRCGGRRQIWRAYHPPERRQDAPSPSDSRGRRGRAQCADQRAKTPPPCGRRHARSPEKAPAGRGCCYAPHGDLQTRQSCAYGSLL